jgi:ubiquinone/menaquinone biosynthesis C-methylase UbiE
MRNAYARGENVMEYARNTGSGVNTVLSILIAYDLQAGSYIADARAYPKRNAQRCQQMADILDPLLGARSSILEVGCGEATTLAGVLQRLSQKTSQALGFDISWSRVAQGCAWLNENQVSARLFVGDLFEIPLDDESIDVVYTYHSLEPNGGREEEAIGELLRVARRFVVLVEPIYELGTPEAQTRMRHHGYVRALKETVDRLGGKITDYRLLDYMDDPLNPSGLIVIAKTELVSRDGGGDEPSWLCPLTQTPLYDVGDVFVSKDAGLAYPVLRKIPMLRSQHAIVATSILNDCFSAR